MLQNLKKINFVWKTIAGFLILAAFFMCFQGTFYLQIGDESGKFEFLPAGSYFFEVEYKNDQKGQPITIVAQSLITEDNKQGLELFRDVLPVGEGTVRYTFEVQQDARSLVIESGGILSSWKIVSTRRMCWDNYAFAILFLALAVLVLLYGSRYYRKEHKNVLCLILCGILTSFPLFGNYMFRSGDICFHIARINGIYEGMRSGQFPVLINPVQLSGYGYMTGGMYPQLFLYIPAALKFLNLSSLFGLKLLILSANLAAALFAYYGVRRIVCSEKTAFMAAVLYTCDPYRLINFYSRGALGEALAMVFLPLVLWGIYEILWGRREKWWILTLAMTGVAGSHVLSLELYSGLVLLELLLWLFSKKREHTGSRILAVAKAALYAVVLNLYFLGPFFRFSMEHPNCFDLDNYPDLNVIDPIRLFEPLARWGEAYKPIGAPDSMSVTLGCVSLAGICLFAAYVLSRREQDEREELRGIVDCGKSCLVIGGLFLIGALWITPWTRMLQIPGLENLLQAIQFPWRLLGITAMLFCIVTAAGVTAWEHRQERASYLWPLLVCGIVLECGGYFGNISAQEPAMGKAEAEGFNLADDLYLCDGSLPICDYNSNCSHIMCDAEEHIVWMSAVRRGEMVECREPETVVWSNIKRDGVNISADVCVDAKAGENMTASFPLHYYPGYRVVMDGEEVETFMYHSYLTCRLAPGQHHIEVSYVGLPAFWACYAVTVCGLLCPAALWGMKRLKLCLFFNLS